MNVLIIEDERPAQLEIIRLLGIIDSRIKVMQCIGTVKESISWLGGNTPDLIFMDIQLADGTCFDIFAATSVRAPVIFITAYDEFAIRAFKVNSIDYLLKPVDESTLSFAIEKYLHVAFTGVRTDHFPIPGGPDGQNATLSPLMIEKIVSSFQKSPFKTRFMVSLGDKIKQIAVQDIAWFRVEGNTLFVIGKDTSKYVINYTLDELNELLDPLLFFRLNRSYTASITSIREVHKYFNSRLKVTLSPSAEEEILISRIRMPQFLSWMDS